MKASPTSPPGAEQAPAAAQAPGAEQAPAPATVDGSPILLPADLGVGGRSRSDVDFELVERDYLVRVARNDAEVEAAQRVRYAVFNLELGEGLAESVATGRDVDRFDPQCDHLLLIERATDRVVGTYRVQTQAMAERGVGFYCATEFDLTPLGGERLAQSVELGRACIVRDHRRGSALFTLWRGVARYAMNAGKPYFFGCCSLTGTDPRLGLIAAQWLERHGRLYPDLRVDPHPELVCEGAPPTEDEVAAFDPPSLFGTYLRYGVKACGPPAIDRGFGTIDFFVLLDAETLEPRFRRLIFEG